MPEFPGRLRTPRLAAAPATPAVGELYYNTADNKLYWWNGSGWIDATGGGGGGGAGVDSSLLTKTQYAGYAVPVTAYQWTQLVVDPSLVEITGSDFAVQGNGTVKVTNAGTYTVAANVSTAEAIPATSHVELRLCSAMTTPTQSDWFGLNSQRMMNYAQISAAQSTKLAANEYVAVWAYHESSQVQNLNIPSLSIVRAGAGPAGPEGGTAAKTFRTGHSWAVSGALTAITLPPIFIPELTGQAATLVGARAMIASGTSIGVQLQRNGSNLGSVQTVTPTPSSPAYSQAITDLDRLGLVLSAPAGSPTDLTFTAILEHVV